MPDNSSMIDRFHAFRAQRDAAGTWNPEALDSFFKSEGYSDDQLKQYQSMLKVPLPAAPAQNLPSNGMGGSDYTQDNSQSDELSDLWSGIKGIFD